MQISFIPSFSIYNPNREWGTTHGVGYIANTDISIDRPLYQVEQTLFENLTITYAAVNYVGSISFPTKWFEEGHVLNGQLVATMRREWRQNEDGNCYLHEQLMYTYAIREPDLKYNELVDKFWGAFDGLSEQEKERLTQAIQDLLNINEPLNAKVLKTKIQAYTQEKQEKAFEAFQDALSQGVTPYPIPMFHEKFKGIRANGGAAQRLRPGDIVRCATFGFTITDDQAQFLPVSHICLDASNNIVSAVKLKEQPKDVLVPMYAGKLHRIISLPVPDQLKDDAAELDARDDYTMLIDRELAEAAGFPNRSTVDFLMVYKNFRQFVRVQHCDVPGHMSLHGPDSKKILTAPVKEGIVPEMVEKDGSPADPNTAVVIGYQLLPYEKADQLSQSITRDGFPNLVVCDSRGTAQSIQYETPSNVLDLGNCSRDVTLSIGDMRTVYSWGKVTTR